MTEQDLIPFPCTKCGACCRLVWANKYFRDRDMVNDQGACIHLQSDNSCGIYATRPSVCRMNEIYINSGLVDIVPIEVFHDRTINTTCKHALFTTGGDMGMVPEQHYPFHEMSDTVNVYLSKVGSDYRPESYPRPKGKQ